MKKLLLLLLVTAFTLSVNAQSLGKIKTSNTSWGLNKMKKAPKKIYINTFNVNFEIYKEAIDFKAGGDGGRIGGNTSSATAKAAVGLNGIDANKMQEKTNELYQNFINRLKKEGYEIVSTEAAEKIDAFKGWQKTSGPLVKEGLTGIINCVPENFTFYYKRKTDNGEIKKGFLGGIGLSEKISKQLDDAIVADVNLHVMFSEEGSDWMTGRAAKVKIKTNLRLIDEFAIVIPQKFKKKKTTLGKIFGSVKIKGATDTYRISSTVSFKHSSQANFVGGIKGDVEINDIMKKQKIVAYQKQGQHNSTSFSSSYFSDLADRYSKTTKWIKVDGDKYAQGFHNVCNTFIDKQLDAFFNKMN